MNVVVFLGPSLPREEAQAILPADYRPPAAQGDVFRAASEGASVIALVDGVFERVPAVWHKEILWALSQGVHVWGASSMGALRAAELGAFGMVGVGAIHARYRDGSLDADDAVAVAHAGPEHGFRSLSVALVDVLCTLEAACSAGVLGRGEADVVARQAAERFFPDRRWPAILRDALGAGLATASAERLRAWLPHGERSLKREDAGQMLRALSAFAEAAPPPFVPAFRFEHTDAWETFLRDAAVAPRDPDAAAGEPLLHHLAADLALDGALDDARAGAAILALAREEARRQDVRFDDETLLEAAALLRARLGLEDDERFAAWREHEGIEDDDEWRALLSSFAARAWFLGVLAADSTRHLPAHLRLSGRWGSLRSLPKATATGPAMSDQELIARHFARTLGRAVPADMSTWLRAVGFPSLEAFVAALRRRARD